MGGRKKSEGGGRGANLTSNAARQGMKMRESGFPHFFVTTKGLGSNPENKISTKNERDQLRQRCSPTVCEKKSVGQRWGKEGEDGVKIKSGEERRDGEHVGRPQQMKGKK